MSYTDASDIRDGQLAEPMDPTRPPGWYGQTPAEQAAQLEKSAAADPRRKLDRFCRRVISSRELQMYGGMLGAMLSSALPMVTTMLDRANPDSVGGFSRLLSNAFASIADPAISEDEFAAQLASWLPDK